MVDMSEYEVDAKEVKNIYVNNCDPAAVRGATDFGAEFDQWVARVQADALQTAALEWQELDPHLVGYDMHRWILERAEGMRETT